ncbi:phosphotransferase family protein [Deinococcus apachensis]|uniref:phosphotransferase family protein n=1 Tax=Deinococcus apachensis TaxID=309886 RepID=UPI000377F44F|nr:aminoglycoside phosphotransferase family protein [Deinococcus apachensis]
MEVTIRAAVEALGLEVTGSHRMPGGSTLPTWQVNTPHGPLAVRLYPTFLEWVARGMARLSTVLREANFPVPGVVAVVEDLPGYVALIQEWLPGVTCGEALRREPGQAWAYGVQFGQLQARLHTLPIPPEVAGEVPCLETHLPPPARLAWLHLDYHPLNVLVAEGRVSAVLDWENVRLGDARADVARTLSILSVDPVVWRAGQEVRQSLRTFRRGYLAGYAGGLMDDLPPFLAWAGEFMLRDRGPHCAEAGLVHVRRWTRYWRSRSRDGH